MPQRRRLITVLKLLLFQTALKVNQAAAKVRENHVNGILGESVLLHIEHASTASIQRITWEKGDSAFLTCENNWCKVYGQNERVQCFPDCSLKLSGLLSSDGGMYRACVTSDIGQIQIQVTYLNVLVPVSLPTIGVHRHNWTGHNNLTLSCSVTEGSSPQYFWEKEDQPLTDSLRYTLMNGNSSISIQPFTAADCGSYTCTVRNSISKHKFRRTLVGDDSSECATSDYLFPVIALATCLVAFSVFLILVKSRVASCKGGP